MTMTTIPTYGPDGRRTRSYSLAAIERLLSLSYVTVKRNRKGIITRAHFRAVDGGHSLLNTCHMGQKYTFQKKSGHLRWWEFAMFLNSEDESQIMKAGDREEIERYLLSVFRAVPLSCLTESRETTPRPATPRAVQKPASPKVVSIDSFRKRRRTPLAERIEILAA